MSAKNPTAQEKFYYSTGKKKEGKDVAKKKEMKKGKGCKKGC